MSLKGVVRAMNKALEASLLGMNDAEAYHRLYGSVVYCVPFYHDRFDCVAIAGDFVIKSLQVVR